MNIDFDTMTEEIIPSFKGGEKQLAAKTFYDGRNRIMKGRLIPGASIGLHTHDTSSEIIYFTRGEGTVICDAEQSSVHAGMCHYCPKGHTHTLVNSSDADLEFIAVVPQQ